ncbi:hypothetical protein DH2020_018618 [Rehmannia glutinosa]|uniref:Peptidase S9 prolyl oligopeptidase catalytic domain-containing protein n=1 Tax=Rehmannia glutinosa TaxID=99300 RepID=A0ABR0WM78_REHGL
MPMTRENAEFTKSSILSSDRNSSLLEIIKSLRRVWWSDSTQTCMKHAFQLMRDAAKLSKHMYRVLTVHGSEDEIIPVEDALEFAKIIPNYQLQIIEGADHRYSSHQDELASVVLRFIKECLQSGNDVSK